MKGATSSATRLVLPAVALAAAAFSAAVAPAVSAHGYMKTPRSRNLIAWQDKNWATYLSGSSDPEPEDCPHCLNRGGTLAQCGVHWGKLNGKAWQRNYDRPLNTKGEPLPPNIQGVYAEGADIEVEVMVTTHHKGHFEFSVCPAEETSPMSIPTAACFARNKLEFVSDDRYGATPDPRHPERGYIAPANRAQWTSGIPAEQPVYGAEYKMTLRLPPGVVGEVVLLQWYYLTANSCKHDGYAEYPFPASWGSDVALYPSLPDCVDVPPDGDGVPEQFWNCAEIKIIKSPATAASSEDTVPDPHEMSAHKPARDPEVASASRPSSSRTPRPAQDPTPIPTRHPTPTPTSRSVATNSLSTRSHSAADNGLSTKTALGIGAFAVANLMFGT